MWLNNMPTCKGICVVICVLSFITQTINALNFDMTMPYKCVEKWDISNSNLYNVAYEWTKHRELKSWNYNILPHAQNKSDTKNCIRIEYDTEVAIPKFFEDYMPSVFSKFAAIHLSKVVCVKNNLLTEQITVQHVPIIDEMQMHVKGYINKRSKNVDFNVQSIIEYPWYLLFIKFQIEKHIEKSLREYMGFLTCQNAVQQKKVPKFSKLMRRRRMIPKIY